MNRNSFQLLTSAGPAAIAVVRLRGPATLAFLQRHVRLRGRKPIEQAPIGAMLRADLLDDQGQPADDILLSIHAGAPPSDVRLHLHGNPFQIQRAFDWLRAAGFEEAGALASDPHAVQVFDLWPAADLLEAEAYALLPRMHTLRGARWLLDQPPRLRAAIDALVRSQTHEALRDGCRAMLERSQIVEWFAAPTRVAVVGPPSAGKSTLVNRLADRAVSLVSPTPGTTRDWIEAESELAGYPVTWLDTAGLRASDDPLEQAGMERTRRLVHEAHAVVVVLDAAEADAAVMRALAEAQADWRPAAVALNKIDRLDPDPGRSVAATLESLPPTWRDVAIPCSATRSEGIRRLGLRVLESLGRRDERLSEPAPFTPRQVELLQEACMCTTLAQARAQHLWDRFGTAQGRRG